jgi:preprotein translocase subunit SecB
VSVGDSTMRLGAARVGAVADLLDLRIRKIGAELHRPAAEAPFSFNIDVTPSVSRNARLAAYSLVYQFSSKDNEDQLVLDGTVELSVLYELPADSEFSDDELAAFGQISVLFTAYPYLREILHSLTGRMGLPPLILDVMRSPLDSKDDDST